MPRLSVWLKTAQTAHQKYLGIGFNLMSCPRKSGNLIQLRNLIGLDIAIILALNSDCCIVCINCCHYECDCFVAIDGCFKCCCFLFQFSRVLLTLFSVSLYFTTLYQAMSTHAYSSKRTQLQEIQLYILPYIFIYAINVTVFFWKSGHGLT